MSKSFIRIYIQEGNDLLSIDETTFEQFHYIVSASLTKPNSWGRWEKNEVIYEWNSDSLGNGPVADWLDEHCQDLWGTFGFNFYFKNSQDAILFKLRWII
jgi:hypothetical protein